MSRVIRFLLPGLLLSIPLVAVGQQATEGAAGEAIVGARVPCENGQAAGFPCRGVDLLAFLPVPDIGGIRLLSDIWGWTDPETGNEYALVAREDGTSFVDISDPVNPVYLGDLPRHAGTSPSVWRDIKVYANRAYIVADNVGDHGMQVFDLTQLRAVTNPPVTFSETDHYAAFEDTHNLAINEETGFAYAVGANTCGGDLHMVDLQTTPTFAGCFSFFGFTHDIQCVVYQGPDTEHQGKEICFASNVIQISIIDVTDKAAPVVLSSGTYPNSAYVHQGWLTDDHRYFFQNDELDEVRELVPHTRTLIWDLADLDDPVLLAEHMSENTASDHNLFIDGPYMFQSNYSSGLRIFDISEVANPVEVAFFDTYPAHDSSGYTHGSWGNYPFFESGTVVVSSIEEGLFILKPTDIAVAREAPVLPDPFTLSPAYPNPFNRQTAFTLTLDAAQPASVVVSNMLGQHVRLLHQGMLSAGTHRFAFDAAGLPSGVYLIRTTGPSFSKTALVLLTR